MKKLFQGDALAQTKISDAIHDTLHIVLRILISE